MSTLKNLNVEFATDSDYLSGPTIGDANKVEPTTGDRQQGLVPGGKFPTQMVNHLINAHGSYLKWLEGYAGACVPEFTAGTRIYGATYAKNKYGGGRFYCTKKGTSIIHSSGGSASFKDTATGLSADLCGIAVNSAGVIIAMPDNGTGTGSKVTLGTSSVSTAVINAGAGFTYPKILCDKTRDIFWCFGFDATNTYIGKTLDGVAWTHALTPAPPAGTRGDIRTKWIATADYANIAIGISGGILMGFDNQNMGHVLYCTDGATWNYQAMTGIVLSMTGVRYSAPVWNQEFSCWFMVATGAPIGPSTIASVVFKSASPTGASWTPVSSHETVWKSLAVVGSVLYAMTLELGEGKAVLFSLDGGVTWRQTSYGSGDLGTADTFDALYTDAGASDADDMLIVGCKTATPTTTIGRLMPQGAAKTVP